jgi:hypothetical protein
VEQAAAEIIALGQREVELLHERQAKASQLKEAEAEAGVAYLDSQPTGAVDQVLKLQAEIAAIGRAMGVCQLRRLDAIRSKWKIEARELQRQAAEKQRELGNVEAKTGKLLAQLSEIEGVVYNPEILLRQGDADGQLLVPGSARLRAEVDHLQGSASELEQRDLPKAGNIDIQDASNVDVLLSALARHEGYTPSIESVLNWAVACETAAAPRTFGDNKRRFRVIWDAAGRIDPRHSYVFVKALARLIAENCFDVAGATFRAGGHA